MIKRWTILLHQYESQLFDSISVCDLCSELTLDQTKYKKVTNWWAHFLGSCEWNVTIVTLFCQLNVTIPTHVEFRLWRISSFAFFFFCDLNHVCTCAHLHSARWVTKTFRSLSRDKPFMVIFSKKFPTGLCGQVTTGVECTEEESDWTAPTWSHDPKVRRDKPLSPALDPHC